MVLPMTGTRSCSQRTRDETTFDVRIEVWPVNADGSVIDPSEASSTWKSMQLRIRQFSQHHDLQLLQFLWSTGEPLR